MNSKQGIEKKLRRWFLLISLVPLIVIGIAGISFLRSSLWEAGKKEIVYNIAEKKIALNHLATALRQQATIFAANKLLQDALHAFNHTASPDRKQVREEAKQALNIEVEEFLGIGGFVAIRLIGKDGGTLLSHARRGAQHALRLHSDTENKSKETGFGFLSDKHNPYMVISAPVLPHATLQNEAIGQITVIAAIDRVDEILSASIWPAYLYNPRKELIRAYTPGPRSEAVPDAVLEQAVRENAGISESGNHIFVYHRAKEAEGVLITVLDRAEVFGPITQLTYVLSIGGVITVLTILIFSARASEKIVDPINRLNQAIARVAEGDFEEKIDIHTGDEIEALALRFSEMMHQIRDRNKDLRDLKYALDQASIVAVTDQKGIIQYVNNKFCEISKYRHEELIGQDHRIINSGSHSKAYIRNMWQTIANGRIWRGQFKNKAKDGSIYWVDSTIVPFLNAQGKPYQYLAIRTNITKQKLNEEEIKRLAQYDDLTGLPNRTLFIDRVNQAIKQNRWKRRSFAVMYIDLDQFKFVNDTMGHSAGDQLLQEVAGRLTAALRDGDTVARMGGDEFTALLPEIAKRDDAALVAKKMLTALKQPFDIGNQELFVSGSIGLSLYPDNGKDAESLIKNADTAMYHTKENGKGHFTSYSRDMQTVKQERLVLDAALRHALEREEFHLCYQPLVHLQGGKIIGMEALLRWKAKGRGLVSPMKFIPLAEQNGLILPIGEWVLKTASAQIRAWADRGFDGLSMSVNVSAFQFQQRDFVEQIRNIVEVFGVDRGALKLELTESLLMVKQEEVITKLKQLKEIGVQSAIDDFGTGYSSLCYLKRFPVESFKIDRIFVRNLPDDPDDAVLAEAIIALGRNMGIRVVAEGIERKDQLAFLQAHGCDVGQGYLFSPPISGTAFTQLLETTRENKCIDESLFGGMVEQGGTATPKLAEN